MDRNRTHLPTFHERGLHEGCENIPVGYGIEQSYDGWWYPYAIHPDNSTVIAHCEGEDGRDISFPTREEARAYLLKEVSQ